MGKQGVFPGKDFETFVAWDQRLSLGRKVEVDEISVDAEQFGAMVELYKPWKDHIESALAGFYDSPHNWVEYSHLAMDFIPIEVDRAACALRRSFHPQLTPPVKKYTVRHGRWGGVRNECTVTA